MNVKHAVAVFTCITAISVPVVVPTLYAATNADQSMEARVDRVSPEIRDAWLDGKLEATLLFNEHLNSFDIDTDVKNGVAYLSGAVESDIDRDLAGEIAESVNGIDRVENKLVVDSVKSKQDNVTNASKERENFRKSVQDATLTSRVKSQLLLNNNTDGLDIDVDSNNGSVTLSGGVKSEQEGDLAVEIARNTEGAKSVTDNLRVVSK